MWINAAAVAHDQLLYKEASESAAKFWSFTFLTLLGLTSPAEKAAVRKILPLLLASAVGREHAIHAYRSPTSGRCLDTFGELKLRISILVEPSLNLLPRFIQAMANSLHTALVDMLKIMPHEESPLVVQFRDDMSILARLTSPEMSLESGTYYAEVVGSNQNFCSTILLAAQSVGKGRFKEQVESSLAAYYFSEVALKSRYGFSLPLGELCWTSDKTTDEVSISCIRSLWKRSLRTEDLESVCAAVGCTNLAPKKTCVRCKMAMYCDATCREAHWSLGGVQGGLLECRRSGRRGSGVIFLRFGRTWHWCANDTSWEMNSKLLR